jgi:hypothetical protein
MGNGTGREEKKSVRRKALGASGACLSTERKLAQNSRSV